MSRLSRSKLITMKFFIYLLYILFVLAMFLLFVGILASADYKFSIFGSDISVFWPYLLVLLGLVLIANIILHRYRKKINKKFFVHHNRFGRIIAGLITGMVIASAVYASTPTITNYSKPPTDALLHDMIDLREDLNYLIGASQYSVIKDEFLNKDVEINNSVITLHDYPALETMVAGESVQHNFPMFKFSPCSEKAFGCGSAEASKPKQSEIPADLRALYQYSILGYSEVSSDKLADYVDFSFSAKISGTTGQCFLLFHRTERLHQWYKSVDPPILDGRLSKNTQSNKFCIDNQSKRKFPNRIFFKESGLSNVKSIDFWLVPADESKNDLNLKERSPLSNFDISDEEIIYVKQTNTLLNLNPSFFCIQGFHKGIPDNHFHMRGSRYPNLSDDPPIPLVEEAPIMLDNYCNA